MTILLIAAGGGLGAVCRAALSNWIKSHWTGTFPVFTFLINISGSFLLGIGISLSLSASAYALCCTGFLGGFTTFSTLHTEAAGLIRNGMHRICVHYLAASYIFGIVAAMAGLMLAN